MRKLQRTWTFWTVSLEQDLPSTLDCTIPQYTEPIIAEEREELRVSGENNLSLLDGRTNIAVANGLWPSSALSSHAAISFFLSQALSHRV